MFAHLVASIVFHGVVALSARPIFRHLPFTTNRRKPRAFSRRSLIAANTFRAGSRLRGVTAVGPGRPRDLRAAALALVGFCCATSMVGRPRPASGWLPQSLALSARWTRSVRCSRKVPRELREREA
jgi:hypothetical protein